MRHLGLAKVAAFVALVGVSNACDWRFLLSGSDVPAGLETPRVIVGRELLSPRELLKVPHHGVVGDIRWSREGDELLVVGERGASFVSSAGETRSSIAFASRTGNVQAIRASADGPFWFLNRGGGWQPVALFDERGDRLWSYSPAPSPNDIAPGDLDGDGALEFVVGMNGGGGVRALDENGTLLWTKNDGNVWHVEVVDVDGDGTPEILHSNAAGDLTVRSPDGERVARFDLPSYLSDFQMVRRGDELTILAPSGGLAYFFGLDGSVVRELEAPLADSGMTPFGTFVRLDGSDEPSFALVLEMSIWDRSVLYVFTSGGDLIYHEVIGDDCREVFAWSRGSNASETLLLGCDGVVWEYALER